MDEPNLRVRRRVGEQEFEAEGRESTVLREYQAWRNEVVAATEPPRIVTDAPPVASPGIAETSSPPAQVDSASATEARAPSPPSTILPRRPKSHVPGLAAHELAERQMQKLLADQEGRERHASKLLAELERYAKGEDDLMRRLGLTSMGGSEDAMSLLSGAGARALTSFEADRERFLREALHPYANIERLLGVSPGTAKALARHVAETPASALTPIGSAVMDATFDTSAPGTVRLRRSGPTASASLLLVLYGFRALAAQESVTGAALQAALTASGVNIPRLDREIESLSDKVASEGERRGRRYSLTAFGTGYVEELLRGWEMNLTKEKETAAKR